MHRNFSATESRAIAEDGTLTVRHQLRDAASKGCMENVRKFSSDPDVDLSALREAMKIARSNGHLDVVRWMVENTVLKTDMNALANLLK